ncbi:hypothetical protein [Kiloniella sp.]|uniref:hypothetical protein n=1 Tax=Kiloniella sp. TaxID=1938587 RepID=UPI003A8D763F
MELDNNAISSHMLDLGLGALAHATHHAMYMSMDNDRWPELSVLQAAHAAEILIKARIAQENPLLIFEKLPKNSTNGPSLNMDNLYRHGRTTQYSALPDKLLSTTGNTLSNREKFDEFGCIRNSIQHFLPKDGLRYDDLALEFIYEVVDPFINECWGLHACNYYEDIDGAEYLLDALITRGIYFNVSSEMAESGAWVELNWPDSNPDYKTEMEKRVCEVLQKQL